MSYSTENGFIKSLSNSFLSVVATTHNVPIFYAEASYSSEDFHERYQTYFPYACLSVILYIVVIFTAQELMRSKQSFRLQRALTIWNFSLAAFSIMGTFRIFPELIHVLFNEQNGFYSSVCKEGISKHKVLAYWSSWFAVSKIIELGDTVFIVLRKQKLIFLHWYHHVSVLLFTWFSASVVDTGSSHWFIAINYLVHSFMYTYYGLRALKIRIPKGIAIAITSLQVTGQFDTVLLLQMFVGLFVMAAAIGYKMNGVSCQMSNSHIVAGFVMYASYVVLFANFFYKAYLEKK